jgi:transcriptional regulator with XRE-family HTH domain
MALRYTIGAKKAPDPTDKHVGARVRMRRKMAAMSQRQLADALGITYQQLQRDEKGLNRIAASRLQQISHILRVPVAFFFEGMPNASTLGSKRSALLMAQIDDFVSDSHGLRLMEAFRRIDNAALRRRIVRLVREIAGDEAI